MLAGDIVLGPCTCPTEVAALALVTFLTNGKWRRQRVCSPQKGPSGNATRGSAPPGGKRGPNLATPKFKDRENCSTTCQAGDLYRVRAWPQNNIASEHRNSSKSRRPSPIPRLGFPWST